MSQPLDLAQDALIRQMRDQIVDNDVKLMAAINARINLVKRLRAYKEQHDLPFIDENREQWMHQFLESTNGGPISADGLHSIYDAILDLTKSETA